MPFLVPPIRFLDRFALPMWLELFYILLQLFIASSIVLTIIASA